MKEVELSGKIDVESSKIKAKATLDPSAFAKLGQFEFLGLIHTVCSRLADKIKNEYIILIDYIDVDWHNEVAQNSIIVAMFSSIRKLCRPQKLKCVVSV